MKTENFETICDDGVKLKGILLIPDNPKAVIQFNCGTGTKKEFYLSFLTYLAENDFSVLSLGLQEVEILIPEI